MSSKLMAVLVSAGLAVAFACQKQEQPAPAATPQPSTRTTTPKAKAGTNIPTEGISLWLIADDIQPAAGGAVASWTNPTLPGVTAAASKPDEQPVVVAKAMNGHAVVRFDGKNNLLMTNADISPAKMPNATIFAVFTSATEAAELHKLYGDDDGGYDRAAGLDNRGQGKNYTVFTGNGVTGYFQLKTGQTYITCDQFTPTTFSGWVDGGATLTNVPANWEKALPNLYIGGTGTIYHEPWQGDLAEIIVYNRTLSDGERAQVTDYLAGKYGVVPAE